MLMQPTHLAAFACEATQERLVFDDELSISLERDFLQLAPERASICLRETI